MIRMTRPHTLIGGLVAIGALMITTAVAASPAYAGSGDLEGCTDVLLWPNTPEHNKPGEHFCDDEKNPSKFRTFYEVETWNSNAEGDGSCAGVTNALATDFSHEHCVGELPPGNYDEAYCLKKCEGITGYAFVLNNSKYRTYFTVWSWWE